MSIFKEPFKDEIKIQLGKRQDAMLKRSPNDIRYINSRNAWVRMSSAVDTYKDTAPNPPTLKDLSNEGNYDNSLAKKYILQGGVLNENGTLKGGVGSWNNAYSNVSADGTPYRLGIRPMPGITGIEIKSLGAYGSLREVTVNYQCWDIRQLEDLELLYMRPGYTVLVEWGWAPYLDNKGNIQSNVQFYDIINQVKDKDTIWKELEKKASENGNYEGMYGTIKNYSWNARPDGGYDCQTVVISMGEVIESLKVNYAPLKTLEDIGSYGYLSPTIKGDTGVSISSGEQSQTNLNTDKIKEQYGKNILAGMFWELWRLAYAQIGSDTTSDEGESVYLTDSKNGNDFKFEVFHKTINIKGMSENWIGEEDEQLYITLDTLCYLLNTYVFLQIPNKTDQNTKEYVKLSVKEDKGISNAETGEDYLLCAAHPLQISVDPSICLIRNDLWASGIKFNVTKSPDVNEAGTPTVKFRSNISNINSFVKILTDNLSTADSISNKEAVLTYVGNTIKGSNNNQQQIEENLKEVNRVYVEEFLRKNYVLQNPDPSTASSFGITVDQDLIGRGLKSFNDPPDNFYELLIKKDWGNIDKDKVKEALTSNGADIADENDPVVAEQEKIQEKADELQKTADEGKENLGFLKNLLPYFKNNDYKTELGIIGNIYVNIQHLYDLALNFNLASQDKKEKNDINAYDFVKNLLNEVSSCIGNTSTLDLFIEPNASVCRLIDIAFTGEKSIYDRAFILEVHGLKTTARSYKLESKIFPEQSTQVAIGAQVGGGALGTDVTTLVDFNKKIIDRIITQKTSPADNLTQQAQQALDALSSSLGTLYKLFSRLSFGFFTDADYDLDKASEYKNALKDLINLFKSLVSSSGNNRAIIPTVFSADIDGIGGLIIGNIFRIPDDVLPKGYKGKGVGSKLGYVITGIGHSVQNGDWITKIDSQTIILDDPSPGAKTFPGDFDYANITVELNPNDPKEIVRTNSTRTTSTGTTNTGVGFPNSTRTQRIVNTYLNGVYPALQNNDSTFVISNTETLGGNLPSRQWLKANPNFVSSLVVVDFPLAGGKTKKLKFHPTLKSKFDIIIPKLKTTKYKNKLLTEYITSCAGSLAIRNATPSTTELSFHSYALAVDLNADRYAYGKPWNLTNKTWTDTSGKVQPWTDFEYGFYEVAKIFQANGVGWYWKNDPHHFSIGEGLPTS
jgi:hypothetical protein